jgi:hypothetical protein
MSNSSISIRSMTADAALQLHETAAGIQLNETPLRLGEGSSAVERK